MNRRCNVVKGTSVDKELANYIINVLRQGTIKWPGREECFKRHRKQVWEGQYTKDGRKKYKYHWQCCTCKEWYRDKTELEVDHIKEIGGYRPEIEHLETFVLRMYCSQDNLQTLCVICHKKKTSGFNSTTKFKRKDGSDSDIVDL